MNPPPIKGLIRGLKPLNVCVLSFLASSAVSAEEHVPVRKRVGGGGARHSASASARGAPGSGGEGEGSVVHGGVGGRRRTLLTGRTTLLVGTLLPLTSPPRDRQLLAHRAYDADGLELALAGVEKGDPLLRGGRRLHLGPRDDGAGRHSEREGGKEEEKEERVRSALQRDTFGEGR